MIKYQYGIEAILFYATNRKRLIPTSSNIKLDVKHIKKLTVVTTALNEDDLLELVVIDATGDDINEISYLERFNYYMVEYNYSVGITTWGSNATIAKGVTVVLNPDTSSGQPVTMLQNTRIDSDFAYVFNDDQMVVCLSTDEWVIKKFNKKLLAEFILIIPMKQWLFMYDVSK